MPSAIRPTVGIDMTTSGARECFVPGNYEVGAFAHCTIAQGAGCASPTSGIPAVGVDWYEPKFANSGTTVGSCTTTTAYDSYNVKKRIVYAQTASTGCGADHLDKSYSTNLTANEDGTYIALDYNCGNVQILWGDGSGVVSPQPGFGTIGVSNTNFRWLTGAHKTKLLYLEGSDLKVYDAATNRWCTTNLSTCASTTEVAYHANPVAGTESFGCNEGDVVPGNYIPLVADCGTASPDIYRYDVNAKSTVTMASPPTESIDQCQLSLDGTKMFCRTNTGDGYTWNAATGAAVAGPVSNSFGHAGFGQLSDGTDILLGLNDGPLTGGVGNGSCNNGNFGPQRKARAAWDAMEGGTALLEHPSPRSPQTTCEDTHWSAHSTGTNHQLVVFDMDNAGGDSQNQVTGGALNANWDDNWRYLSKEIVVCDYEDPASDPVAAPNCWRIAHSRRYADSRDCSSCVNITRDGRYVFYRSYLGTDVSAASERLYIIRADLEVGASSVPTLTSITPDDGTQGTTVTGIAIVGTNLNGANPSVTVSGTGVTPQNLSVSDANNATVDLVVAVGAATGARDFRFVTDDGTSNNVTFTVNAAASAPTLSSLSPSSAWRGAQVTVVFTGTDLNAGSEVLNSSCSNVTFPSHVVDGPTQITAQVLIEQGTGGFTCNFSVTTANGTSENRTFTVNAVVDKLHAKAFF